MSDEIEGRTTQDRFYLSAKVIKKPISFRSRQSGRKEFNAEGTAVILVPEQSTECDCFFSAWLPEKISPEEASVIKDLPSNYSEIVFETGYPINGYFRGALCPANSLINRPHIFVMTKRAEELLLINCEGKKIRLTSLAEGEEEALYELNPETRSPIAGMRQKRKRACTVGEP